MALIKSYHTEVADRLHEMSAMFKPGALLTLFVRYPGKPAEDFLMSADDLSELIMMIHRAKARGKAGSVLGMAVTPANPDIIR